MSDITFSKFELGPRRGVFIDLETQLDAVSISEDHARFLDDYDLIYRALCGILFNFVPKSGHPGGSISCGPIVESLLFSTMAYDFADPDNLAYLLNYDSTYGRNPVPVSTHQGGLRWEGGQASVHRESTIDGVVLKDLRIKADTITLGDHARIDGDLIYTSRTELPPDAAERVAGEIVHKEVVDGDDDGDDQEDEFTVGTLIRWLYWPLATFIVGTILLGLTGRHKMLPVQRMNEEGWTGLAIGLFALPVLAVASVVAMILVLTIPLGIIGLFLLAVLAFVGKIPAAIWLGNRVLGLGGNGTPSPYLSLALGLLIAYLAFSIPYFIGLALWYVATSAGIGALILAIVALRQSSAQTSVET